MTIEGKPGAGGRLAKRESLARDRTRGLMQTRSGPPPRAFRPKKQGEKYKYDAWRGLASPQAATALHKKMIRSISNPPPAKPPPRFDSFPPILKMPL